MANWNSKRKMQVPGMNPPKVYECKVCGSKIVARKSERYVVKERVVTGGLSNALAGNYTEPKEYDAFDCPVCGCQFIAKERLRKAED